MYLDRETGEMRPFEYRSGSLNYDTNEVSINTGLYCRDPSMAQQSQKDEADINTLVQRFGIDRVVEMGTVPVPRFVDVTDMQGLEFTDMVSMLNDAQKSFMMLPAKIRGQFENDPAQFVEFCMDPANVDEMVRMGLAVKKPLENNANVVSSQRGNGNESSGGAGSGSSSSGKSGQGSDGDSA